MFNHPYTVHYGIRLRIDELQREAQEQRRIAQVMSSPQNTVKNKGHPSFALQLGRLFKSIAHSFTAGRSEVRPAM